MEYISDVIRGPFPFLLVIQILIIASLLLMIIWWRFQALTQAAKLEQSTASIADAPDASSLTAATAASMEAGVGSSSAVGSSEAEAQVLVPMAIGEPIPVDPVATPVMSSNESAPLSAAALAMSAEEAKVRADEVKALNDESMMLKDKVKYLESRLMEYEIVQEEISTLSALRVENEKLKEELLKMQAGVAKPDGSGAAPSAAPDAAPAAAATGEVQIDSILKKLDELTSKS